MKPAKLARLVSVGALIHLSLVFAKDVLKILLVFVKMMRGFAWVL
jgi:hypothetical protein